ncbi:hypothetical protein BDN67DRAFT_969106 [Paxillus ammoniavirescens]|nr:hypothetical protein BDN67DRAFT_969106 [Paxillus ammoniavirescens]
MYLSSKSKLLLLLSSLAISFSTAGAEAQETPESNPAPVSSSTPCLVRAWVRAPDLVPGEIIEGDTRIKLEGDCPSVESYSLGLRFKERLFRKIRNPDAPLPQRPTAKTNSTARFGPRPLDVWEVEPHHWRSPRPEYDEDAWKQYESAVKAKELWDLHEEERLGFEAKTPLTTTGNDGTVPRVFVQTFSLLIPYTNYPPTLDHRIVRYTNLPGDRNIVNTESIYEYFAEIRWSNGTRQEVLAGMTAFAPVVRTEVLEKETFTFSLHNSRPSSDSEVIDGSLGSNYSAKIELPSGLQIQPGSAPNLTVTIFRSGYTNRTDKPLSVCLSHDGHVHSSVREPGFPYENTHPLRQLSVTAPDPIISHAQWSNPCPSVVFPEPKHHDVDEGVLEVTASYPVSVPLRTTGAAFVDFEGYYASQGNHLSVFMYVRRDPREPLSARERERMTIMRSRNPSYDADDYDWLPWTDEHMGTMPRTVHGNISLSIPSPHVDFAGEPPVHYLSPTGDVRAPIFVDPKTVDELRALSLEERDALAPLVHPRVSVTPRGEESFERYFTRGTSRVIYVGETWAKKVLPKLPGGSQALKTYQAHGEPLLVQV